MLDPQLSAILRCPDCRGALTEENAAVSCSACKASFPIEGGIPNLIGTTAELDHSEIATQDHVSDYYELERYRLPHARAFHKQSIEDMCRHVRLDGLMLDNGCGTGFLTEIVSDIAPDSRFVGIDISAGMLEKAKPVYDRLVRGDSTRLPFADASFDTVFGRSLLHHLSDPEAGVHEMLRVLKPGGDMIVLDTHKTILSDLPRRIANRGEHFDEDHKNFRTRELVDIVGRHFSVDRVDFMGYVAYPLLGFPDIHDFSKWLPVELLAPPLLRLDHLLSNVPLARRLGWGIMIKGHREATS